MKTSIAQLVTPGTQRPRTVNFSALGRTCFLVMDSPFANSFLVYSTSSKGYAYEGEMTVGQVGAFLKFHIRHLLSKRKDYDVYICGSAKGADVVDRLVARVTKEVEDEKFVRQ